LADEHKKAGQEAGFRFWGAADEQRSERLVDLNKREILYLLRQGGRIHRRRHRRALVMSGIEGAGNRDGAESGQEGGCE
jgi:hypothetical protein